MLQKAKLVIEHRKTLVLSCNIICPLARRLNIQEQIAVIRLPAGE